MEDLTSASSSTASSSAFTSYHYYDVFINHRGPDVKSAFASSLYRRLISHRLQVFLDKPELQAGHSITIQIEAAIKVASVHIAIFSPTYAESNWCLDELLLMVESKAIILPVFYKVKPSEVRWTGQDKDGAYAKALRNHEQKQQYDLHTIQRWRDALHLVANISGFELQESNRDEGGILEEDEEELLVKVVQTVLKKVQIPLDVAKYPTGLGEKLQDFEVTLQLRQKEQAEAKVVGIVGIGGIGKTTLAKEFFNRKRSDYNGSSFLFNVRENRMALNNLQSKLIKDLKDRDFKIERWEEGVEILKKNLKTCEALIILDDVGHVDQLDAFLPIKYVLDSKSLILVTSRDKHILRSAGIADSSVYHLQGLNIAHSQELFCSHAFFQPHPLPGFENLVNGFLTVCHGLPLSLKVLGALVCGHEKPYWEEQLDGLHQTLPTEIEKSLKISYDSLNHEEQQIFLDIACFSVGKDRDTWIRIWSGSGWKGLVGFQNLLNKCLVEVDNENIIRMHDHLIDLGRNIAHCSELLPRRLWQPIKNLDHLHELLEQSSSNKQVITEVRGFMMAPWYTLIGGGEEELFNELKLPLNNKSSCHEVFGIRKLQLLEAEGDFESILTSVQSPKLTWLRWNASVYSALPSWIPLHDLRVLEVFGWDLERLWQCESQAPLQLRELNIEAPLSDIPKSLGQLKHLEKIVLDCRRLLKYPDLSMLPEEFCYLSSLKYLHLIGCWKLQLLPNSFGNLKNLQHVHLSKCNTLKMLPNSFGNLANLQYINLSDCGSLKMLPKSFGNLTNLKQANLSKCNSLEMLPSSFGNLTNLQDINLTLCGSLKTLPDSFENLTNLQTMNLTMCRSLKMLPNSFGNLKNLQYINLSRCESLEMLPNSFGNLTNLQDINLSLCGSLKTLPDSFENLTNLQTMNLTMCRSLKMLPDSFGNLKNLQYINLSRCKSLKMLPSFWGNLSQLRHLHLSDCCNLTISTLGDITTLECLDLSGCLRMGLLPSEVGSQQSLEKLNLFRTNLKELPSTIVCLSNLKLLMLGSPLLRELPPLFGNLTRLKELWLHGCQQLKCLPDSVAMLSQLRRLKITECGIQYLPVDLMKMENLELLKVTRSPLRQLPFKRVEREKEALLTMARMKKKLTELNSPISTCMIQLKELELCCTKISEVSFSQGVCPNLQILRIKGCKELVEVGALPTTLITLDLRCCRALGKIGGLSGLAKLEELDIRGCNNIKVDQLDGVEILISLKKLWTSLWHDLKRIPALLQQTTVCTDDFGDYDHDMYDYYDDDYFVENKSFRFCRD